MQEMLNKISWNHRICLPFNAPIHLLSGHRLLWFWCKHPNNFHRKWLRGSRQCVWSMALSGFFAFKELVQKPWRWSRMRSDTSPCSVLSLRPAGPPGQAAQEPDNTVGGVFPVSLGLLLWEKGPSGWSTSGLRVILNWNWASQSEWACCKDGGAGCLALYDYRGGIRRQRNSNKWTRNRKSPCGPILWNFLDSHAENPRHGRIKNPNGWGTIFSLGFTKPWVI